MKRNRFSKEPILAILKEHAAGVSVLEQCRKQDVSDASLYMWKAKFGAMDASQARRLKPLENVATNAKRLR